MNADYLGWRDRLADGMDARFYTIEHVDRLIASGAAFAVCTDKAAIVIEIRTFPTGLRAAHYLLVAGDLAEMTQRLRPAIEDWARGQGCDAIMFESRPGWARVMRRYGYEVFQTSAVKEL